MKCIFKWNRSTLKARLHYELGRMNSTDKNFNKLVNKLWIAFKFFFYLWFDLINNYHLYLVVGYISYNFGLISFSLYNTITMITILYYFKYNSINFHLFTFVFWVHYFDSFTFYKYNQLKNYLNAQKLYLIKNNLIPRNLRCTCITDEFQF